MKLHNAMLFLILSLILLVSFFAQGPALMSDQYERARSADEILARGFVPETLGIYQPAPQNTYAPAFDLFSAVANSIAPVPYSLLFLVFSFALLFLIFTYSYKTARLYLSSNYSAVAACIAVLLPWVFRRIISPIPESFGLAVFLMLLYYALRRNTTALAFLFPMLALLHYRSFLTFGAIYIIFCIWALWKRELKLAHLLRPVPLLAAVFAIWFLPRIGGFQESQFQNPWLVDFSIIGMFGIAALLAVLSLGIEFGKAKRLSALSALFLAGLAASALPFWNFSFREAAFAFFPAAFLCALAVKKADGKFGLRAGTVPLTLAGTVLLILILLSLAAADAGVVLENRFFTNEYVSGISALNEFGNGGIVLSDFVSGYLIPYYTSHKVAAGPFMEALPDAEQRASEMHKAFARCSFAPELFARYNAELLYIPPDATERFNCALPELPAETAKVYSSDNSAAYILTV